MATSFFGEIIAHERALRHRHLDEIGYRSACANRASVVELPVTWD
jgi:hypothetical protein